MYLTPLPSVPSATPRPAIPLATWCETSPLLPLSGPVQNLRKDTISKPQEWIVRANLPENVLRDRRRDVDEEDQQKVVI